MQLLQDEILKWHRINITLTENGLVPDAAKEYNTYASFADIMATGEIALRAQTILFDTQVMLDLIAHLDRIDLQGDIHLPYPYLILQFTQPIPEDRIMMHKEVNAWQSSRGILDDYVEGLILANPSQDSNYPVKDVPRRSSVVWFSSKSVTRVAFMPERLNGEAAPDFEPSANVRLREFQKQNHLQLIRLAYAVNLFLNAENVYLEAVRHDPVMQAKRERKGKRRLPEYHIVKIDKVQPVYTTPSQRTGRTVSRMFPVRGHFRKLHNQERRIWIPNHFRGLKHGPQSMVAEVYAVTPEETIKKG